MAKTKGDFLKYATSQFSNINTRSRHTRPEVYDASTDVRDEATIEYLRGTNESDDGPTPEPISDAEGEQRQSIWPVRSIQTDVRPTEYTVLGVNAGVYSSNISSNGAAYTTGSDDITFGDSYGDTYQSAPIVQGSPRTAVKRTSLIDKMAGHFGQKASKKKVVKSAVSSGIVSVSDKLLTIAEVSRNRPLLLIMLEWTTDNMDYGISAITRYHREVEIWSNMTHSDMEILVDAFLDAGQRSRTAAKAVRTVMQYYSKLQVGVILGPRIYQTMVYTLTTGIDLRM